MFNPRRELRFQFSIASLLLLMTVVAVALMLITTAAGTLLTSLVSWIILYILPSVLLASAIYGKGDIQAFALGALVPVVSLLVRGQAVNSLTGVVRSLAAVAIVGGICGVAAVITRRLLVENEAD